MKILRYFHFVYQHLEFDDKHLYDITTWKCSSFGNEELIRLFGPPNDKLPVIISYDGKKYKHLLTEEFVYGLLTVFDHNIKSQMRLMEFQGLALANHIRTRF